jgi:hypothetical protein
MAFLRILDVVLVWHYDCGQFVFFTSLGLVIFVTDYK